LPSVTSCCGLSAAPAATRRLPRKYSHVATAAAYEEHERVELGAGGCGPWQVPYLVLVHVHAHALPLPATRRCA
jgi:hypothetical protein